MLTRLADLALRRPRRILLTTGLLFVLAVAFGAPVAGLLSTEGGFTDPESESVRASERIERNAKDDPAPRAIVLVRGDVGDAAVRERVTALAREARAVDGVAAAPTFYETRNRSLVSREGDATFIPITFRASAEGDDVGEELRERLEDESQGVLVGGPAVAGPAIGDQVSEDLAKAELLAFPLLFLLSLWVFRGVVAALLPLFVGVLTIFGTFLTLRLVHGGVVDLSIFALNLAIALGLGLAIDYSLFVVSRYREEIERLGPGGEALRATLRTAGKTILFSAVTVAVALAALLVFPQKFLYSMGIAGAASALIAGLVSVTALPALLVLLGDRVNALAPARWKRPPSSGGWHRLAHWNMRRAIPVATVTALALILLGLPALGIKFTGVDASALGESSSLRQVEEALRTEFPRAPTTPVIVALDAPAGAKAEVDSYAASLRDIEGVVAVDEPRPLGGEGWTVDLLPRGRPFDEQTQDIVEEVRSRGGPFEIQVAGEAAEFVDQQDSLTSRLPLALGLLCLSTLVILFVMTGSAVLPVKALLMNLLTLSGAFGLLVLIFQEGRLEGLLDYTSQGALEATQPVVMFAVAFALSTDYGVFLLTRIKEARDAGHRNEEAVALGLERTGRIVTAAALLLSVAIGAFATSQVIFIKQVGLGTVFAVLIDATLVRAFLMPSLMKLLGEWNWWAPAPLRRLHGRLRAAEA